MNGADVFLCALIGIANVCHAVAQFSTSKQGALGLGFIVSVIGIVG